jgi:uncharacterized membrane protein
MCPSTSDLWTFQRLAANIGADSSGRDIMATENMPQQAEANKSLTHVIYGLYAASLVVGITYLVAIILNYVKRDDVKGTYLESHFDWQIKTFWFSLLGCVVGTVTTMIIIGFVILGVTLIWYIYRIAKGWLRLNEGQPIS